MTKLENSLTEREHIAYELGILAETDMQTDEMKENEIIAMAIKYGMPINELKQFNAKLNIESTKRFLESIK